MKILIFGSLYSCILFDIKNICVWIFFYIYIVVDGNWGAWQDWGACSVTCGSGIQEKQRECNSPPPMNGGLDCEGNRTLSRVCNVGECPPGNYVKSNEF